MDRGWVIMCGKNKHAGHCARRPGLGKTIVLIGVVVLLLNLFTHKNAERWSMSVGDMGAAAGEMGAELGQAAGEMGAEVGAAAGEMGQAMGEFFGGFGASVGQMFADETPAPSPLRWWPLLFIAGVCT
jgi:hypothetical protein